MAKSASVNTLKCFLVISGHMCNKPLGMQNGGIKNVAVTASSMWDRNHGPWLARLNARRMGRQMSGWSAKYKNRYQWLQVDLGRLSRVIRVGSQGRMEVSQWITAYSLSYSVDGVHFAKYRLKSKDKVTRIDHFRVAFRLCFKARPSAKPFMWKLLLFTCKWTKICLWINLIPIWKPE